MLQSQTTLDDDASEPDLPEDRARARAAKREARLERLADIGMEMAEALCEELHERRAAPPDANGVRPSVADLSLSYSRAARAVRQTVALEAKLDADAMAQERARAAYDDRSYDEIEAAAARVREKAFNLVQLGAERDAARAAERAEAGDGAEDDDADDEIGDEADEDLFDRPETDGRPGADRAPAEVIAQICRDLGVECDLGIWTDDEEGAGPDVGPGGEAGGVSEPQAGDGPPGFPPPDIEKDPTGPP